MAGGGSIVSAERLNLTPLMIVSMDGQPLHPIVPDSRNSGFQWPVEDLEVEQIVV